MPTGKECAMLLKKWQIYPECKFFVKRSMIKYFFHTLPSVNQKLYFQNILLRVLLLRNIHLRNILLSNIFLRNILLRNILLRNILLRNILLRNILLRMNYQCLRDVSKSCLDVRDNLRIFRVKLLEDIRIIEILSTWVFRTLLHLYMSKVPKSRSLLL